MDIKETLRILRRRWYITGPLLLLAVAGSAALAARSGPYQAESQVVLLPSAQTAKVAGGNPYMSFNDSVTLTADLLRRQLIAPPLVQSLGKNGYRSSYQVVDDPLTAGPVLDITVTGNSKSSVEHTLAGVTAQAGKQLRIMQGQVARIDRITLRTVSYNPKASLLLTKKARTPLVALAIGLLLAVAVPVTVDAAVAGRRRAGSRTQLARRAARHATTIIAVAASWPRAIADRRNGGSPDRPARRAARRTATIIAAAGSWARVAARTSAEGRPGATPDGVISGPARGEQPGVADRLWADSDGERWPDSADVEPSTAGVAGHEGRAKADDGSAGDD